MRLVVQSLVSLNAGKMKQGRYSLDVVICSLHEEIDFVCWPQRSDNTHRDYAHFVQSVRTV